MNIEITAKQATAVRQGFASSYERRFYFFPIKPCKTYPRSDFCLGYGD